jgi:UDP-glucose 4-epimerase
MTNPILVVGGAGYIGSHMVKRLAREGLDVVTLDDLSKGYREAVVAGDFVRGNVGDERLLDELFSARPFDAVMHFASFIEVGESVADPGKYYRNNVANTIVLLDAMARHGIKRFVFSSTAAVYGEPIRAPIDESHPIQPINPYGATKAMVERMLEDYDRAHGLKSVRLRYFNACGADPDGELGERHNPETHLIPLVLQAASGRRQAITVFGEDYDTPDGTCIRDYIHVVDLCEAHLLALDYLAAGKESVAINLGNAHGHSIRHVIETAQRVTGRNIPVISGARRPGDPARLVADSRLAGTVLGWKPRLSQLETIIEHAWRWEKKLAAITKSAGNTMN